MHVHVSVYVTQPSCDSCALFNSPLECLKQRHIKYKIPPSFLHVGPATLTTDGVKEHSGHTPILTFYSLHRAVLILYSRFDTVERK